MKGLDGVMCVIYTFAKSNPDFKAKLSESRSLQFINDYKNVRLNK
jgi:hypothetical protein